MSTWDNNLFSRNFIRERFLAPKKNIMHKLSNGLRTWVEFNSLSMKFVIHDSQQLGTIYLNDRPLAEVKRSCRQKIDKINLSYIRDDKIAKFVSYERLLVPIKMVKSKLYLYRIDDAPMELPDVEWLTLGSLAGDLFVPLKAKFYNLEPQLVLPLSFKKDMSDSISDMERYLSDKLKSDYSDYLTRTFTSTFTITGASLNSIMIDDIGTAATTTTTTTATAASTRPYYGNSIRYDRYGRRIY